MKSELIEKRFEIDTKGFKTQMSEMPLWRLIQEIISNGFDEPSVRLVTCNITQRENEKLGVQISDDGKGFEDYKDIFTLYKDSNKRTKPESRGRFNLGEKQFFAVAESGIIQTGKWNIGFFEDKRRVVEKETKSDGVYIEAVFKTDQIPEQLVEKLSRIITPRNKILKINNQEIRSKEMIASFESELMTPLASGKNQKLVLVKRKTRVNLYKIDDGEPYIYELGLPIQKINEDIRWHVEIMQKVPQVTSRDVVSTKYLQKLYAEITKNTLDLIDTEESGSNWISQALKKTDEQTTRQILQKRYGTDKIMIESKTDYRANESALLNGFHLLKSGEIDSDIRNNLKGFDMLKYAGQEFSTDAFEFAESVMETDCLNHFAKVCKAVAVDTIGKEPEVKFVSTKDTNELASYSPMRITWNVTNCGGFDSFKSFTPRMIGILIHELAHDKKHDDGHAHLSNDFINEMERIAGIVAEKGIQSYIDLVDRFD